GSKIFRDILKYGGQSSEYSNQIDDWSKSVSEYRSKIQDLKTERNKFIAHLNDDSESRYRLEDIPSEIKECIVEAVKVVDTLKGKKVGYTLSVGSMEKDINLRK